jgi:hypothetical protein
MAKVMLTLRLDPARASLEDVMRTLDLSDGQIDRDFGVVNVDPQRQLYAISVETGAAHRLSRRPEVAGPYASPKIEPFGPVR